MLIVALFTSISAACTSAGPTLITGTLPADGDLEIPVDSRLIATYGWNPLVGEMTLTVDGDPVAGTTETWSTKGGYFRSQTFVAFAPDADLEPNTEYTLSVQVPDYYGTPQSEWISTFTTSEDASVAGPVSLAVDAFEFEEASSASCQYDYAWKISWTLDVPESVGDTLVHLYEVAEDGTVVNDTPLTTEVFDSNGGEFTGAIRAKVDADSNGLCVAAITEDAAGNPSPMSEPICHFEAPDHDIDDDGNVVYEDDVTACSTVGGGSGWMTFLLLPLLGIRSRRN